MKTLVALITSLLIFGGAHAQLNENFNQNITGLASNCWVLNGINYTTTSGDVINGTGSAYTNPPTSSSGERTIGTPFLNVNSSSLNVSFLYKISSKIAGNATRTINIGLEDRNGVFTSLQVLTMDRNSPTTVLTHNATYSIATLGVYRLVLRIGGSTGDGNSRVIFDDLYASASAYYGPVNYCNPAAVAVDNSFTSGTISPISGNVLLNDNIPSDNEVYSASVVSAPTTGSLVLNSDGTFTYTPPAGFTGGTIVFSYLITDNGFPSTSSNTAVVTLNFPAPVVLPLKLLSFNAATEGSIVRLAWRVDENETGNYFEVEKSSDGKTFTSFAKVPVQDGSGVKEYAANDHASAGDVYYRLKMVNKDNSTTYSKVLVLKNGNDGDEVRVLNNPATSSLSITYQAGAARNSNIRVYSIAGVKVYEQKVNAGKGINMISIPVQTLQAGTYVLVIDNVHAKKFIKG